MQELSGRWLGSGAAVVVPSPVSPTEGHKHTLCAPPALLSVSIVVCPTGGAVIQMPQPSLGTMELREAYDLYFTLAPADRLSGKEIKKVQHNGPSKTRDLEKERKCCTDRPQAAPSNLMEPARKAGLGPSVCGLAPPQAHSCKQHHNDHINLWESKLLLCCGGLGDLGGLLSALRTSKRSHWSY
ncbi:hypothetical protein NDU88_001707 [Pleurodeles waltl]|uniref:Uncharacterized protein n=1 Tax=Pleurodeles waltl TaxID=8319 RepID=A0AAV7R9V8_PLEWA|nr:hypothetical protein NDU88_001707 [Pleurodeles waltl]